MHVFQQRWVRPACPLPEGRVSIQRAAVVNEAGAKAVGTRLWPGAAELRPLPRQGSEALWEEGAQGAGWDWYPGRKLLGEGSWAPPKS